MTVLLKPLNGGRPIVVDKPILLVGRHPDCDIIIKDSPKISRKHCCLALVDNRFVVRDLESMNGVFVNGNRVEHSADVKFGQELVIGDVSFELVNTNGAAKSKKRKAAPKIRDESGQTADAALMDAADKVEFSSAFAVPVTDSSQDDDFIPLADVDDSINT
jgi:pSer/pThr/pTyr-binding forkhead associated (FHA) protein